MENTNIDEVMPFRRIWSSPVASVHNIYVGNLTQGIAEHLEAIDMIRSAGPDDTIRLYVTSCGGEVDIAENYREAMLESPAHIITIAIGIVASAGTLIFLSGAERIVKDSAFFMFHNVQLGAGGDMANVGIQADFYRKMYIKRFSNIYKEILSPTELDRIFNNANEVYLTAEEMRERLAKASQVSEEAGSTAFKITLEDGYTKQFDLKTLTPDQFNEYSHKELEEIAKAFGLALDMNSFEEDAQRLTSVILQGGSKALSACGGESK